MVDPSPVIRLCDVTLDYGSAEVVSHVDLDIHEGKTTVILGPSGVGKSTILKCILGLLKPTTGKIFVHGTEISELPERELVQVRLRMAMVFQHGALFDSMTVADNVSFRIREHGLFTEEEGQKRMREALAFVGLENTMKLKPAQLSGGMKKRVAIARALASEPEVLLFDEPTTGLDPINLYNVEQLILRLKKQARKFTLVMVTHDIHSAFRLADSMVVLHQGKFIFQGTPGELKQNQDKRIQEFLDPAGAFNGTL